MTEFKISQYELNREKFGILIGKLVHRISKNTMSYYLKQKYYTEINQKTQYIILRYSDAKFKKDNMPKYIVLEEQDFKNLVDLFQNRQNAVLYMREDSIDVAMVSELLIRHGNNIDVIKGEEIEDYQL